MPMPHEYFSKLAQSLYANFDYEVQKHAFEFVDGDGTRIPIQCKQGCSYCCHLEITLSFAELVGLVDFITECRKRDIHKIRTSLRYARQKIDGKFGLERKASGVMCPLLGDDGSCSVYPARPLACRAWLSSDCNLYKQDWENPASGVQVPQSELTLQMQLQTYLPQLMQAQQMGGMPSAAYELIRGLEIAISTPNFAQVAVQKPSVLNKALMMQVP